MSREFNTPIKRPSDVLENWSGQGDPAEISELAHETAAAVLARLSGSEEALNDAIRYIDEEGIDELAELWEFAPASSLPGALWRLYVIRTTLLDNEQAALEAVRLGIAASEGVDGSNDAPTPEEVLNFASETLRGAFTGDFGVGLEKTAMLAHLGAEGLRQIDESKLPLGEETREERANRFEDLANDLLLAAARWKLGKLN